MQIHKINWLKIWKYTIRRLNYDCRPCFFLGYMADSRPWFFEDTRQILDHVFFLRINGKIVDHVKHKWVL